MSHLILDTETTGLQKPFCYDVGYKIIDNDGVELCRKHYIVEQVWHNLPLFESAYYKEKRPLYIQAMRRHEAIMDKWGYIMRALDRDIRNCEVTDVYAYNSKFDDDVFTFNCDWFKCINPLESLPIYDIWGYSSQFITNTPDYQSFCEKYQMFTDSGNYKGSAESVYSYINDDETFQERHIGIYDVDIETDILLECIELGAQWGHDYKVIKVLPRIASHPYTIKINGQVVYQGKYIKKYVKNDTYNFTERP